MKKNFFQYILLMFIFLPAISSAQETGRENYDFYISKKGNDSFPGTSKLLAKKTIAGVTPLLKKFSDVMGSVKVGLRTGDIWDENLVTSYPIHLSTYEDNSDKKDFAILNGSKEFRTGWIRKQGTFHTFHQSIPYNGFVGYGINLIGGYSFIYVTEIDKALEKTAPFTARKLLQFVTDSTMVENTPGSFSTPTSTNEYPMPVYIHTSDGSSPNENLKYRYEVTVRDWAVNSTYQQNNHFENLWIRGFGAGIGMLPGGSNSSYNKIIFGPGAAIHHLAMRSGMIDHSLFLPAAKNTNGIALVFYDVEGLGRHCTIKNTMFLDIPTAVYAHTSLGTNYGAVEVDNVLGFADSSDAGGFMFTSNNDTVILNNVYTDRYTTGYNYGNAKYASISNSYFKDVNLGIAYSAKNPVVSRVSNVFIRTKGSGFGCGIFMQDNTYLTLTNSIIHVVNSNKIANKLKAGSFVYSSGEEGGNIIASGNIFICDIDPSKSLTAAFTNTNNGIATSKDTWTNNVYILLKGKNIYWAAAKDSNKVENPDIQNFEEWKRLSGQDKNSLFFDLRNDKRGLKAIFADPDNGNYDLADTPEGRQIAALGAGMTTPITCFLQKPTYEEAAEIIRNDKVLSVNNCRNPCLQNSIRVNATFNIATINNRQIKLNWNISEQQNIDHYEIQCSKASSIFKRIGSLPVSVDSSYAFTDDLQPNIEYRYRLLIASKAGGKCYSNIRTAKMIEDKVFTIYPNPSTGKVLVSMNGYNGAVSFVVSNSSGQIIIKKDILSLYSTLELDLRNQPRGVYFLKLKTVNGITVQKFSLQ